MLVTEAVCLMLIKIWCEKAWTNSAYCICDRPRWKSGHILSCSKRPL